MQQAHDQGKGESTQMTTQELRATMISLLVTAGYSYAAVVLRSGNRNNKSLKIYHNLHGENGRAQLTALFYGNSKNGRPISHQPQDLEND